MQHVVLSRVFILLLAVVVNLSYVCANEVRSELTGETDFYFEPDVGFVPAYTIKSEVSTGGSAKDNGQGMVGGLNMGWQTDYVHLFIAYRGSLLKSADTSDLTVQYHDYGVGVGWEWNIPLMTSITAIGGQYKASVNDNESDTVSGGFGFRLALSYFMRENIKLNLNYSDLNFAFEQGTADVDVSSQLFFASLSIPFEVGYPDNWWRLRRR